MQQKDQLYPLKFQPILKSKVWGGNRLTQILGKHSQGLSKLGESWEISSVPNELSVVSEGYLEGQNIEQVIEKYKGQLVGEKIHQLFGNLFPLLIKFIDANDYLSVQVHPDDELAKIRHNSYGKTEMWYIVNAEEEAELIVGFNQHMNRDYYLKNFEAGNLLGLLNREKVEKDDVFFIPAGRVHATGPGILFAEIQQTSDITYRVYDWDRKDDEGNYRELHTELALDSIDFSLVKEFKTKYEKIEDKASNIVTSTFFTTNSLSLTKALSCDYSKLDSFVVLMAIDGQSSISYSNNQEPIMLNKGETILVPAIIKNILLTPLSKTAKILETHM